MFVTKKETNAKLLALLKTLTITSLLLCTFCTAQNWSLQSAPPFLERDDAVGFAIGNKGYFGTGRDLWFQYRKDFFEYDGSTWTTLPSINGIARQYAVSFSFTNKGCVLTGIAPNDSLLKELQCYYPDQNQWKIENSFPGLGRLQSCSFEIGKYGFCGNGRSLSQTYQDWYRFDSQNNTWQSIADFPLPFYECVSFSIGGFGYVGLGRDLQGNINKKFYRYNLLSDTWEEVATFPGNTNSYATGFEIHNKGFVCTGLNESYNFVNEFWEYDSERNKWTQLSNPPFSYRRGCEGFSIDNEYYLIAGIDSNYNRLHDNWKLSTPANDTGEDMLTIYPNPTDSRLMLQKSVEENVSIIIYDTYSKKIDATEVNYDNLVLDISNYPIGFYFLHITSSIDDKSQVLKFVKR